VRADDRGTVASLSSSSAGCIGILPMMCVETLFYIGAETTATSIPRAWTEQAVERRIGLSGLLLKAIAAMGKRLAMGPGTRSHSRVPGGWLTTWRFTSRHYRHLPSRGSKRETTAKIPRTLRQRI
jgi:hypothetical protein